MKTCEYRSKLGDYIDEALPAAEKQLLEQHLVECRSCAKQVAQMQQVSALLQNYQRPEPPLEVLYNYHTRLEKLFPVKSAPAKISEWFADIWRRLFGLNPAFLRLAGSAALIIIGIFIGRLLFYTPEKGVITDQPRDVVVLNLNSDDLKMVADYFIKSEILLLAIKNTPENDSPQATDLFINKQLARDLLSNTTLVQQKAALLNDQNISVFLNQIEFLLLEIANTEEQEIKDAFTQLSKTINNLKLINESENMQKIFKDMI